MKKSLILELIAVLLITICAEQIYFNFRYQDMNCPYSYTGDGFTGIVGVKNLLDDGGGKNGYPFFLDTGRYTAHYKGLYTILIRICGIFSDDAVVISNIWIRAIPVANVLVCFLVLRYLKTRTWLSFLLSLTYGFSPYVQGRLFGHMSLATIECIPLVFLICFWLNEDDSYLSLRKGWTRDWRNWATLLFTWMIANNGMVYYPFFSCFVFLVVAVCLVLRTGTFKKALPAVTVIGATVFWLFIGFIPTVIGMLQGVGNVAAFGSVRSAAHAVIYGLKLSSLILSPHGYGISGLVEKYQVLISDTSNENNAAYLGITAVAGFLLLLLSLFVSRRCDKTPSQTQSRWWILSRITIAILLLSMINGFGCLVAVVIPQMRCYNRISPFLLCASILAVATGVEGLLHLLQKRGSKQKILIIQIALCVIMLFALWEQRGTYALYGPERFDGIAQAYLDDQAFFSEVEAEAGEGAMVFQLPYMKSFENGSTYHIPDYDHYRGRLHTDTLRWSYGAMSGSENDLWYASTAKLSSLDMVAELKRQGFAGIYLNLYGYDDETGARLKESLLHAVGGGYYIQHTNGNILYIPLDQAEYDVPAPSLDDLPQYHIGDVIWFSGADWDASRCVLSGLSENEGSFTWTSGDFFAVEYVISNYDMDLKYYMDFEVTGIFNGTQRVVVNTSENPIVAKNGDAAIRIPVQPDSDGFVSMTIHLPDAVSPAELGQSADGRRLALAIQKACITAE